MSFIRTVKLSYYNFREQARAERAHLGNFWFMVFSRVAYNVTFVVLIDAVFQRVGSLAGYSKNDFFFMYFISQIGFYMLYMTIFSGLQRLVQIVRTGDFDLLLLKPVPHRTFLYISGMQPFDLLFSYLSALPIIIPLIHWGELHVTIGSALLGVVVMICGMIIGNTFMFALTLPAFKSGDATDMMNVFYSITSMSQVPYSKLPLYMKVLSLGVLPQLIISAAASEVILTKGDTIGLVVIVLAAAGLSFIIFQTLWRYALRNYTSASS
jgi:ABC-type uncharacterized transport system permease subunit